jgi:hypothetical protein
MQSDLIDRDSVMIVIRTAVPRIPTFIKQLNEENMKHILQMANYKTKDAFQQNGSLKQEHLKLILG